MEGMDHSKLPLLQKKAGQKPFSDTTIFHNVSITFCQRSAFGNVKEVIDSSQN